MNKPKKVRTAHVGGFRYEWWQYDGHYIVKCYAGRHFEGSERFEGKAPPEDRAAPAKAKTPARPPGYQQALKRAIKRKLQDRTHGAY